jgi:hypothetical protein
MDLASVGCHNKHAIGLVCFCAFDFFQALAAFRKDPGCLVMKLHGFRFCGTSLLVLSLQGKCSMSASSWACDWLLLWVVRQGFF